MPVYKDCMFWPIYALESSIQPVVFFFEGMLCGMCFGLVARIPVRLGNQGPFVLLLSVMLNFTVRFEFEPREISERSVTGSGGSWIFRGKRTF